MERGGGAADVVRLRGAGKRYGRGGAWVLRDLDLTLAPGRVVELRGVNGSGKSTLLRMLAGASVPSRGTREAAAGLTVGYGPERPAPPPFRAGDWLGHHARLRAGRGLRLSTTGLQTSATPAEIEAEAAGLAARLGCAELLGERMAALSKGSLQKIVLIQAFLGGPGLLVLDEPFDGLDAEARLALSRLVAERAGSGAAVVFSDHRRAQPRPRVDSEWTVAAAGVTVVAPNRAPRERFHAETDPARVFVEGGGE
jgi:ABC-type multidrug transport system ATPase subunit